MALTHVDSAIAQASASNADVKREPGTAQGTGNLRVPWLGQLSLGTRDRTVNRSPNTSRCRHARLA